MIRLAVILLCCFGLSVLLSRVAPSTAAVAFTLGGYGISWLLILCLGGGFIAYKATK